MTEKQWLRFTNVASLVRAAGPHLSARKRRLFACACCRRVWDVLPSASWREAVLVAERLADGVGTHRERKAVHEVAKARLRNPKLGLSARHACWAAVHATNRHARNVAAGSAASVELAVAFLPENACRPVTAQRTETRNLGKLFRHIVGNPFHSIPTSLHWAGHIRGLAEAIYAGEDGHFALHDALLEAGNDDLAEHLRDPEEWHPKGCWALDLILGKS